MFRATQQWVTKERGPGQRKCPWAIPELWLQMGNRWVHRPFPTCFQDMRPNQERTCLLAWESAWIWALSHRRSPIQNTWQLQIDTCHWDLPSTSTKIKSCAGTAADFQHSLQGFQGGEQKWGTLCSEKPSRTGLQIVWHSQELVLWVQFF